MPFATSYRETFEFQVAFVVVLRDRYSGSEELAGEVIVKAGDVPAGRKQGGAGAFLFSKLAAGVHDLSVESASWTPYYVPVKFPVTVPVPPSKWPAYPDVTLANLDLALDDAGQKPAFRDQFVHAALSPTIHYPFDGGATLVRGTVTSGGAPLSEATVSRPGGNEIPYVTGTDGQFVLFFEQPPGVPRSVTIHATHAALGPKDRDVTVTRGVTAVTNIDM